MMVNILKNNKKSKQLNYYLLKIDKTFGVTHVLRIVQKLAKLMITAFKN